MTHYCKSIGCCHEIARDQDYCEICLNAETIVPDYLTQSLSERYPDQYREIGDMDEIDPAAVLNLFEIPDHSGCLQQAAHKLLMTGTSDRLYADIKEVRDILTRWMQLNQGIQ